MSNILLLKQNFLLQQLLLNYFAFKKIISFNSINLRKNTYLIFLKQKKKSKNLFFTFTNFSGDVLFHVSSARFGIKQKRLKKKYLTFLENACKFLIRKQRKNLILVKKLIIIFKIRRSNKFIFNYKNFFFRLKRLL
jgi:hypothetical protein